MVPKSCIVAGKKIKFGDDLVSSGKKKKYPKQHDIPDDVVSPGRRKS